jgi:hypothetical protein
MMPLRVVEVEKNNVISLVPYFPPRPAKRPDAISMGSPLVAADVTFVIRHSNVPMSRLCCGL